jgi:hypothetical protein
MTQTTQTSDGGTNPMQLEVLELIGSSKTPELIFILKLLQNLDNRWDNSIKDTNIVMSSNQPRWQTKLSSEDTFSKKVLNGLLFLITQGALLRMIHSPTR